VVKSCVVWSLNTPVAVSCRVVPTARLGLVGVTSIVVSLAAVTVAFAVPLIVPSLAVIVALPAATPCITPVSPTVAIVGPDDDHLTIADRSMVVASP